MSPRTEQARSLLRVENGPYGPEVVAVDPNFVRKVLRHNAGVLSVAALGLLVAIVVPVVGVYIYCCFSKKAEEDGVGILHRGNLARAILAIIAIVLVLGSGFALASNQFISSGIQPIAKDIRIWKADTRLYLKNTEMTNYTKLSGGLVDVLEDASHQAHEKVDEVIKMLPLDTLTDFLDGLKTIHGELMQIQKYRNEVNSDLKKLREDFSKVKTDIDRFVNVTATFINSGALRLSELRALLNKTSSIDIRDPGVPEVQTYIREVEKFTTEQFKKDLTKGKNRVDVLQNGIKEQLKTTVCNIKQSISDAGLTLSTKLKSQLEVPFEEIFGSVNHNQNQDDLFGMSLRRFEKYRYYAFLAVALILLLVSALVVVGLLTGLCCKGTLPDVSFKIASALICLTASVLMLATTLVFVLGFAGEKVVCQTLRQPGEGELFSLLDVLFPVPVSLPNGTAKVTRRISSVIKGCRKNGAIYDVLGLDDVMNIDSVKGNADKFKFDDFLTDVKDRVIKLERVAVLPDGVRTQLESLRGSHLSTLNVTDFMTAINASYAFLDGLPLYEFQSELKSLKNEMLYVLDVDSTISTLEHSMDIKKQLRKVLVNLTKSVDKIGVDIKLNSTNFTAAIQGLIDKMNKTGDYIHKQAPEFYQLAEDTAHRFKSRVTVYLDHVVNYTKTEAAKCRPLGDIYDSMTATICDTIVNPVNGFWVSAGWCLMLFLPTLLILSCS